MRFPLVLLYHAVAACPPGADAEERGLFLDPGTFEEQMDELAERGFRTLTLDQYASAVGGVTAPSKSFLLTFDDAYAHVADAVSPVLRRHGFSAVMFACWRHLGSRNTWDADHPNLAKLEIASRKQLAEMSAGMWEIASHGLRHIDLRRLAPEARRRELIEARYRLSHLVKKPVVDLAYPYGFDDAEVRSDAREAGYRMAFTAGHSTGADPLHLSRHPIRGTDSPAVFWLKTSGWSDGLYRMRGLAPDWARSAARNALGADAR